MDGSRYGNLRLVWSRPPEVRRMPPRRINLAHAIERHLSGGDGLTDEQFAVLYATGRRTFPVCESK